MKKILWHITLAISLAVAGGAPAYADDSAVQEMSIAVELPAHQVKPGSHCIEIVIADDSNHQIAIYALTGQVVKQFSVAPGNTVVDIAPGYYIVRIDGLSKRVVVK